MADQNKPVIVLINGAAHTPESWDLLCQELTKLGYESSTGNSPTINFEDAKSVDLFSDANEARGRILKILDEENRNVLVVSHSYGGAVGSEAVEGLCIDERGGKPGVIGLVYLAAFLVPEGHSVAEWSNLTEEDRAASQDMADLDMEKGIVWFKNPDKHFYHDHTPERTAKYKALLKPYSTGGVMTNAKYAAFTRDIWKPRCRYIILTEDMAMPLARQQWMIKEADMKVAATIKIGHIPQSVIPEQLAQVFVDIAQELAQGPTARH